MKNKILSQSNSEQPVLKRNTIVFKVKVKRGQKGTRVFKATGRILYLTEGVADSAPLIPGNGEEKVNFVFFKDT